MAAAIQTTAEELEALDRAPFRRMLGEFLGVNPTKAALRKFANKSPDRWAQALSILASLAGYERGVLQVNVYNVKELSDAQLLQEARLAGLPILEGEFKVLPEPKIDRVPSSPEGGLEVSNIKHTEQNKPIIDESSLSQTLIMTEDGQDGS